MAAKETLDLATLISEVGTKEFKQRLQIIRLLKKEWQEGQIMVIAPANADATDISSDIHGPESEHFDMEVEATSVPVDVETINADVLHANPFQPQHSSNVNIRTDERAENEFIDTIEKSASRTVIILYTTCIQTLCRSQLYWHPGYIISRVTHCEGKPV